MSIHAMSFCYEHFLQKIWILINFYPFEVIHLFFRAYRKYHVFFFSPWVTSNFDFLERVLNLKKKKENICRSIVPIFQWHILHVQSEIDFSVCKLDSYDMSYVQFGCMSWFSIHLFYVSRFVDYLRKQNKINGKMLNTKIYYAIGMKNVNCNWF